MKQRLLIKLLKQAGYIKERETGDHIIFKRNGFQQAVVPRHREINENTARKILKLIDGDDEPVKQE